MSKLFEQLRKAADARAKAGPSPARPEPSLHDLEVPADLALANERALSDDTARQVAAWQAQSDIAVALAKKLLADEAMAAARAAAERERAEDEAREALERRLEAERVAEAALLRRIQAERRADEAAQARLEVERLADEQAQRLAELERQVQPEEQETESPGTRQRPLTAPFAKGLALIMMLVLVALAWTYAPWRGRGAERSPAKPLPALKLDPSLKTK